MGFLCFLLSTLSGCCGSLAAIAISWTAHVTQGLSENEQNEREWKHVLSLLVNLAMTGLQVLFGFAATRHGPVAVVMPLSVGAALLSNMILQLFLRLARFSNASITGTLILVAAVLMLTELGPGPPREAVDALGLLSTPQAIFFIVMCLLLCFGSLLALRLGKVTRNLAMLVLFALVGGAGTVLNMSIQKMLMSSPPALMGVILLAAYVGLSILCLWSGTYANARLKDPSLFVPINNAVNLCLNCLAGLFIWGDLENLEYPRSYILIYVQVGLGSYLVSSVDVFSMIHLQIVAHLTHQLPALSRRMKLLKQKYSLPEGVSFNPAINSALLKVPTHGLLQAGFESSFPHLHAAIGLLQAHDRRDFERRFRRELQHNMVTAKDVVRLCADLLERTGGISDNQCLKAWVSTITTDLEAQKIVRLPLTSSGSHLNAMNPGSHHNLEAVEE